MSVDELLKSVIIGNANDALAVLNRLMKLAKYTGSVSICDNNSKEGVLGDRKVEIADIETTVRQNPEAYYIIANKWFYKELKEQLKSYGIEEKNIYICDSIASGDRKSVV